MFPFGLFLGHEIREFLDFWIYWHWLYISRFQWLVCHSSIKWNRERRCFPLLHHALEIFLMVTLVNCTSTGEVNTTLSFLWLLTLIESQFGIYLGMKMTFLTCMFYVPFSRLHVFVWAHKRQSSKFTTGVKNTRQKQELKYTHYKSMVFEGSEPHIVNVKQYHCMYSLPLTFRKQGFW